MKPGSRAAECPRRSVVSNLRLFLRTREKSPDSLQERWLKRSGDLAGSGMGWEMVLEEESRGSGEHGQAGWAQLQSRGLEHSAGSGGQRLGGLC